MKIEVFLDVFVGAFEACGRGNYYSYEGFEAIFNHLIEVEEATGIETELDPVAVSGEFTEYEDIKSFNEDYGTNFADVEELKSSEDYNVIGTFNFDKSFVIQEY